MMSAGVLSSKACIVRRPVAFVAPKASAPRGVAMRAVRAEGEEEKEKKEAKKAKAASLRTDFASTEAIDTEVQKIKFEMFAMRIQFAKREIYQPAQYTALKKRVAQLLTIRREREIEAGIGRRDAKAAEKRRLVEAGLAQF